MKMSHVGFQISPLDVPLQSLVDLAHRHDLRELSIFGSILRDDFGQDSDVDVLIELAPGQTMTVERYLQIHGELEALFRRRVDLVEKPLLNNPYRRGEILRTRKVLYAA